MKKVVAPYRVVFPTPAALVTTADMNGNPNVATAGEVFMISLHPLIVAVGFRPATYTNELLHATKEFVVNLPRREILKAVDYCGCVSGRKVDKFKATGLTPLPAKHVKPPLIEECPVNIECLVKNKIPLGIHHLFLGEIVQVHVDQEILNEKGRIDFNKGSPFVYNQGEYWSLDKKIGTFGFSKKQNIIKG